MDQRLVEIAEALADNFKRDKTSSLGFMWERACLYAEARSKFKSNNKFGEWLSEVCSTDVGKTDSSNTIAKLIMCHQYLDIETFVLLGHSVAFELMVKTAWTKHGDRMGELVTQLCSENRPVRVVRAMVKGVQGKVEKETPEWYVKPNTKAFEAIRVSIRAGEYMFSDSEFFHPQPEIRELQIKQVTLGSGYAVKFFGFKNDEFINYDNISRLYKKLALKYHPDRQGGSDELMAVVNRSRAHFMRVAYVHGDK